MKERYTIWEWIGGFLFMVAAGILARLILALLFG